MQQNLLRLDFFIDKEFQRLLAKALKRGVSVYLGYGYQSANEPAPLKKHEIEAEENLLALKEWCADKDTDGILVVKKFRFFKKHSPRIFIYRYPRYRKNIYC